MFFLHGHPINAYQDSVVKQVFAKEKCIIWKLFLDLGGTRVTDGQCCRGMVLNQ